MGALYLLISALIVAGDQLLKYWITQNLQVGEIFRVIPGFLHFTYLRNTGAAWSMFQGMRWPLIAVSCLCSVAIVVYLLVSKERFWNKVGLALVLGGAVGNLLDRIRLGFVVDMFEVEFISYPVFNVADCCIVVGGTLFCVMFLFFSHNNKSAGAHIGKKPGRGASAFPETGKLVNEEKDTVWTETRILEAYDLERMLAPDAEPPQTPDGEEPPREDAEDDRDR